jgi:hypothetical protein
MATKLMEAMMANKKYRELILEEMKKLDRSKPVTRWDIYNCVTSCATHGRQITASANAYLQKKAQEILINEFDPASIEVEAQ